MDTRRTWEAQPREQKCNFKSYKLQEIQQISAVDFEKIQIR